MQQKHDIGAARLRTPPYVSVFDPIPVSGAGGGGWPEAPCDCSVTSMETLAMTPQTKVAWGTQDAV